MKSNKISLILGLVSWLTLVMEWSIGVYELGWPPQVEILSVFGKNIHNLSRSFSFLSFYVGFGFLFVLVFSLIGFWLGLRSLKDSSKIVTFFAFLLNFTAFIFSLLIAWLLFGLARGM